MQYLVVFSNKERFASEGMPTDFKEKMVEDQAQIKKLYAEGTVRQVWALARQDRGGVVLFEANSAEHLQGLIDEVPFVQLDYNDYQILPLDPYPGFAP